MLDLTILCKIDVYVYECVPQNDMIFKIMKTVVTGDIKSQYFFMLILSC